ncbi:MAG: Gx transporter family protein [Elusimicrobia bacterium]|nr:Gx transporter family protein [Elusimicrobiota bacterium]
MENKDHRQVHTIAVFVTISCVLQIAESLIPHPIPGLRLGLSNVMTLIALVNLGFGYAMEIAILRTVVSSFILGTFMSPTFFLSFSGAVVSTLIMGALYWLSSFSVRYRLSIVGISIFGALTHNIVQLSLAYFILIKNTGIFSFLPWLCIGAVIMGWFTGLVAGNVCRKIKEIARLNEENAGLNAHDEPVPDNATLPAAPDHHRTIVGHGFLSFVPAEIKIIAVSALALGIFLFADFRIYAGMFAVLAVIIVLSKISFAALINAIRTYASLVLLAFLFPLVLNHGSHIVLSLGVFDVTAEGLSAGVLYSMRILFLILANSLLMLTTTQQDLTRGLAKTISPLKIFGVSPERIAAILSLSLVSIPSYMEVARKILKESNFKQVKTLYALIPLLSGIIVALYTDAERKSL